MSEHEPPAWPPPLPKRSAPTGPPPAAPPPAAPPPAAPPPVAPQAEAYPPPAPPPPAPVHRGTSGFAIASLVLGIVWLYWIGSILALVFGYISLRDIKRSEGTLGGRGMAIAGVVLGWIGIATLILTIVFFAAGGAGEWDEY